jgi:hypothetical protein
LDVLLDKAPLLPQRENDGRVRSLSQQQSASFAEENMAARMIYLLAGRPN